MYLEKPIRLAYVFDRRAVRNICDISIYDDGRLYGTAAIIRSCLRRQRNDTGAR